MNYEAFFAGLTREQRLFLQKALELDALRTEHRRNTHLLAMSVSNALGWNYDSTSLLLILVGLAQHGKVWNIKGEDTNLSFRLATY